MTNEIGNLKTRRKELLDNVTKTPFWVYGSVVETTRKICGKQTPFYYLSQSINGKNKITYISATHLGYFKRAAAEGAKIRRILNELSSISVKLIKKGCFDD